MKKIYLIILFTQWAAAYAQKNVFEFHNNSFVNAHHYFYAVSSLPIDSVIRADFGTITDTEKRILTEHLTYYKDSLTKRDLLFDKMMYTLKFCMIEARTIESIQRDKLPKYFKEHFAALYPIYLKYLWDQHKFANQKVIDYQSKNIESYSESLTSRLSQIFKMPWTKKVNIYVSFYSNWAKAYTSSDDEVITTIYDGSDSTHLT